MTRTKVHPSIIALMNARNEFAEADVAKIGSAVLAVIGAREVAVKTYPSRPEWNCKEFLDALHYFVTGKEL